jgi:hypothetical protein
VTDEADLAALTMAVAMEVAGRTTDAHTRYATRFFTVRHENGSRLGSGGRFSTSDRRSGGALSRFANEAMSEPVRRSDVSLRPDHEALVEGRTIFPKRIFGAADVSRILVSGRSNAKIGGWVTVGPWAGMPIYTLTLEERKTCPRSCAVWAECYGNGMPSARRLRVDDGLICKLEMELERLDRKHPRGFVVRLHVLGDFADLEYLAHWLRWFARFAALRVWGYTAHAPDSPIGVRIARMNVIYPGRWAVRFSVGPEERASPMQAAVVWVKPDKTSLADGSLVCPQELGHTETCGTCGICWKPELSQVRVLFFGHGGRGNRGESEKESGVSRGVDRSLD